MSDIYARLFSLQLVEKGRAVTSLLYAIEDGATRALPIALSAGASGLYEGLQLGVYSALRTYEHCKFLQLEHHIERTARSMARLGWQYAWDEARLRRCLDEVCAGAPFDEMRVRFDVLAAPGELRGTQSRELIALTAFTPPGAELYERGVSVATTAAIQRDDPLVKAASFVARRREIETRDPQIYEHLIVDAEGQILEGLSSNFYALREGVLYTAGSGVLEGVTRRIVLQCAAELAIPVVFATTPLASIAQLDEAAISSSSRGLLSVVNIDGQAIGQAAPGALIGALRAAYDDYVTRHVCRAV